MCRVPLVTVLTATYNRADRLNDLYRSLCQQTSKNFCWLIVDDGSTDNTQEVLQGFVQEARFPIKWFHKKNGGRHTAINSGVAEVETELTFLVDSDDTLCPDAIVRIEAIYEEYRYKMQTLKLCGFCFLKGRPNGQVLEGEFPAEERVGNYIRSRLNRGMWGDKAEVFYTRVLREFPFPEFLGEHFLSEDAVWIPMALKYDIAQINEVIYLCDYLEGGLTKDGRKHKMTSPQGGRYRAKQLMNKSCCFKCRLKGALLYDVYSIQLKVRLKKMIGEAPAKFFAAVCYVPACFFVSKWNKDVLKMEKKQ